MAITVDENRVIAILGDLYDSGNSLTEHALAATEVITDICVNSDTYVYTDLKKNMLAVWMTAHFYCIMSPQSRFESVGKVQKSTDSKVDLGLDQTRYGQAAKLLDTAGNLARWDGTIKSSKGYAVKPRVTWVGTVDPGE